MLSLKLHIKQCDDLAYLENKQKIYSFAFRKAYRKASIYTKLELTKFVKENFGLNDIEARSLVSEVKSKFTKTATNKKSVEERIVDITEKLAKLKPKENKTKKEIKTIFKLNKKMDRLSNSLPKDIVFGGKYNLKKISYLSNYKGKIIKLKNGKEIIVDDKLSEFKDEYSRRRCLPFFIMGEANQTGNRFFNFDLENNIIIYKPKKKTKIKIDFSYYKNYTPILAKLQSLIEQKLISVSVMLSTKNIHIVFDESILNGYSINEIERKKEVDEINARDISKEQKQELIKEVYKLYYRDLEEKKLIGKLRYRYLAIDQNPNYIGCAVLDKNGLDDYAIVNTFYYNIVKLNAKLPKEATAEERKRWTNKRKHGICHIWKDIFNTLSYYNCGYLAIEDLDFKINETKDKPKEANRQIYNVWHRNLSSNLINKYCNLKGINIIPINAAYTSTIGNLLHSYIDCVNSAIEIGRRAIFKFEKGSFYPPVLTDTIIHTMSKKNKNILSRDVECIKGCSTWVELHVFLKESELRYRGSLNDLCLAEDVKYSQPKNLKHSKISKVIFN